ncbi:DUF7692 domain-containing protein [Halomontanus rarus]|uniref:DUF7692 domain-containing protein n=1 Tax=Halomontanus rarus TaxID=3034020 RepID=UPI003CE46D62
MPAGYWRPKPWLCRCFLDWEPSGPREGEGAIEKAANFYDCNRSNAATFACEDVDCLVHPIWRVLDARISRGSNVTRALRRSRLESPPSTSRLRFRRQ